MKFEKSIIFLLLAILSISSGHADENYWKKLELGASKGDSQAQADLAMRYMNGDDIPKDMNRAVDLLKKSASQGNPHGKIGLGKLYLYGQGVKQDFLESRRNFKEAFDILNNKISDKKGDDYYSLAHLYLNGNGVHHNDELADKWFKKAAESLEEEIKYNNVQSMMKLGSLLIKGLGVNRDTEKAIYYFKMAAEQGNILAQVKLASLYMDLEQYEHAMNWLLKAEKQNSSYAQNYIGSLYGQGLGVDKNENTMLHWMIKSAKNGNEMAQTALGEIYLRGLYGVAKDKSEAKRYYSLAAKQGSFEAKERMKEL